jgi:hypothetical protein
MEKESLRPATALSLGNCPFPFNNPLLFVIPSEAEGSAVPQTFTGNTKFYPHAALDIAACAAFVKESSMKCANATKFHRKSGGA